MSVFLWTVAVVLGLPLMLLGALALAAILYHRTPPKDPPA